MLFKQAIYSILIFIAFLSCHTSKSQVPGASFRFPDGKDSIEVPFTRDRGWIIIKVKVNNSKTLSFVLDSGSPIAILSKEDASNELHLDKIGNANVTGDDQNESKSVPLAGNVSFDINGLQITNGMMAIGASAQVIPGIDGIIGKYLFDDAVVKIDWAQNKLVFIRPQVFKYSGNGLVLPVHLLSSGHFYTEVEVASAGHKLISKADIDLGNVSSYFSIDKAVGATLLTPQKTIPGIVSGWGANGPVYGDISSLDIKIGSIEMKNVVTTFRLKSDKKNIIDGNIGIQTLEKFNPIFDYKNSRLILEKNENFEAPFFFNRTGIITAPRVDNDHIIVAGIIPNSPASEAGMVKGDKITAVNQQSISSLSSDQVAKWIVGRNLDTVEIEVLRDNKKMILHLTAKQLLPLP